MHCFIIIEKNLQVQYRSDENWDVYASHSRVPNIPLTCELICAHEYSFYSKCVPIVVRDDAQFTTTEPFSSFNIDF